jgi:cytochrome c
VRGAGQTHPHQRFNTILHYNAQQASTRAGKSAILQTNKALFAGVIALVIVSPVLAYDFGHPATPDAIALWDRCPPSGEQLPPGSATAARAEQIFRRGPAKLFRNK